MATKRRAETAQENREKMIRAARKAFAEKGYAAASMDELTASVGLTRGALYHNFNDKKGLLAAVVAQIDSEMAANAKVIAAARIIFSRFSWAVSARRFVAMGLPSLSGNYNLT
ncbi:TetR/AcrR family transcriptional regulator, partial [Enterobacter hormaechei]|uniref:TetR/AcrR family transcriptional regulator n=1 Tax=Enterobacter hormaechei TaxID=158836 RepID=UPI001F43D9B5